MHAGMVVAKCGEIRTILWLIPPFRRHGHNPHNGALPYLEALGSPP
jgi:hypothetical protein